jgi:hypothetical protein
MAFKERQQDQPIRRHHLRVPVLPEEKERIELNARETGLSVAAFLREVGQGYQPDSVVDMDQVREMVRINADLGRLGGLLKLWLTDDARMARFSAKAIVALLNRIEASRAEMTTIMRSVVMPRTKNR